MRTRLRRASLVSSALIFACAAIATRPIAAYADDTSTVGWIRLAQLSPTTSIDGYLSPSGSAASGAQPTMAHAAYGTMTQYQAVAPGGYSVAMRTAGSAATTTPLAMVPITVAPGQAYTVAAFGAATIRLQVLNDEITAPPGKAGVRVIEASRLSPTASVLLGPKLLANNLRSPGVSPYQTVDPGTSALLITTKAATTQTVTTELAANSTYTVVILDGTEDVPRVLVAGDASGMTAMPKGGVATGFGGMAASNGGVAQTNSLTAPLVELLLVFSMLGLNATVRLVRRRRQRAAQLDDMMRLIEPAQPEEPVQEIEPARRVLPPGNVAPLRNMTWLSGGQ